MKKLISFILLSVFLFSCSNDDLSNTTTKIISSIQLNVEGYSIEDSPLTRAVGITSEYGIIVKEIFGNDTIDYAAGVFDKSSDITIELNSENKYDFYVVMINTNRSIELPFETTANHFLYKEDGNVMNSVFNSIESSAVVEETMQWDMYYGENLGVIPSKNGQTINLKRVGFGIEVTSMYNLLGDISISVNSKDYSISWSPSKVFFRMIHIKDAFHNSGEYSEVYPVVIKYTDIDGAAKTVDLGNVVFKRNRLHTIHIKDANNSNISFTLEDDALMQGDSITVGSDGDPSHDSNKVYYVNGKSYEKPVAVDLGLPSGLKWASANLCQTANSIFGSERFSYGSVAPSGGFEEGFVPVNSSITQSNYDPATFYLGSRWYTPTIKDINELVDNCTFEFDGCIYEMGGSDQGSCSSVTVTGPNGHSISIPASYVSYVSQSHSVFEDTTKIVFRSSSLKNGESQCFQGYYYEPKYNAPYNRISYPTYPLYAAIPIRPVYK